MGVSRRDFMRDLLTLAAAAPLTSLACGGKREPVATRPQPPIVEPPGTTPSRPRGRYFVVIWMQGGFDAVGLTDPKTRAQVDQQVDIPYGEADVLEVNGHRYGPNLRPLERWLNKMAIVNGVQTWTVQHPTESVQIARLRTGSTFRTPSILELAGNAMSKDRLATVTMGSRGAFGLDVLDCSHQRFNYASKEDLCSYVMASPPEELTRAADGLDAFSAQRVPADADRARRIALFMRRVAGIQSGSPFQRTMWRKETEKSERAFWDGPQIDPVERDFQRLLWLLENDLTATSFFCPISFEWDSHIGNAAWQTRLSIPFFEMFARFLDELHTRKNQYGVLADNTTIVLGSGMGRFPYLNAHGGKDHFPEAPFMFFGPRVKGGVYGATGRRMESVPVDLKTGKADRKGEVLLIDDVGTSMLRALGIEPSTYGYGGRQLDFLVEA
jgi:uncharacterized protein (DUF1501 family)